MGELRQAWIVGALAGLAMGMGSAVAAESGPCADLARQYAAAGDLDSRQVNLALFKAADNDCAELAAGRLQRGAAVVARDALGRTALIHAARAGAADAARLLIERGS